MNLPVKFPSETDVILDDVARFRTLSTEDRFREIRDMLNDGTYLMHISPKAEWLDRDSEEQTRLAQHNIREFIARHVR